jgi:type III pantothenate kinase
MNYLGGRISPGLSMRFQALNNFTDKLPLLSSSKGAKFIGNDTNSSIISGVQNGIISEVSNFISDYKKQNKEIIVVFTGGDCFFFEKELKISIFADPFLVLKGLNEILDFNE